ncbi:Uncharacterised protein [Mycobacteroides abscessus subsp. abscessus]|nr:Uncharacterised protein [Mycobacteroides abscessus subsp. abscessus]
MTRHRVLDRAVVAAFAESLDKAFAAAQVQRLDSHRYQLFGDFHRRRLAAAGFSGQHRGSTSAKARAAQQASTAHGEHMPARAAVYTVLSDVRDCQKSPS